MTAIPGNAEISDYPKVLKNGGSVSGDVSTTRAKESAWGWQLATGSDTFAEAIPDVTSPDFCQHQVGNFHLWRVISEQSSLAFIRRANMDSGRDIRFVMLSSTRMVDIVILNLRAEYALNELQVYLRQDDEVDGHYGLSERLEHIEQVQRRGMSFRRYLWFNAIGHRVEDTEVLNAIQQDSGNRQRFEDFNDELESRKQIYETIHQRKREDQREADEKRDNNRNLIIAIAGIDFAVPTWFEIFGSSLNPTTGTAAAVVAIILFVVAGVALNRDNRKR